MKNTLILCLTLFFLKNSFSQNNYKVENAQQRLATLIVNEIEKNNIDSVFQYFDPAYLKSKQPYLKRTLTQFYTDYKTLIPDTKRFVTLVWPTGFNLFRFRYIDSTGTVLQIDLSFKNDNIDSKVLQLETIDRLTFKKQRAENSKPGIKIEGEDKQKYPYTTTLLLRNCSKEMRTVTFHAPIRFFKWWAFGNTSLESQKVLFFSKDYQLDSNFLRENIDKIKKSLPKNFWTFPTMGEKWYNNEPNEEAIWFTQIFVQIDKPGNIKIFSAYKVTFEGTDARIDTQRANPKIKDIEFITDKEGIQALEKKLKSSSPVM